MPIKSHRHTGQGTRGQVILGTVLLFLFITSTIVFGLARSVFYNLKSSMDLTRSRSSYYLAEALVEDVSYRYIKGYPIGASESLSLDGNSASAQVTDIVGGKTITSTGSWSNLIRKVRVNLTTGTGGSFFYGVQVGTGGLSMANNSSIAGNVHSSGPITASGNYIYGDALSAGSSGLIDTIHATSSAYAHTIKNSHIDKDAYYVILTNTTVSGTSHPNSPDQATTPLPISDVQIDQWESDAAAGGSVTCTNGTYTISVNTTIGPKKIPCKLIVSSNPTITLAGALWVTGDIEFQNQPVLKVSSAYINVTIPIIADNPSSRTTGSTIDLGNNSAFQGSGTNSYVLMISRNTSAEGGGSVDAINADNSLTGEVLLYAPHGNISMSNSVSLREVTAYKLTLKNSAKVLYKSGLANILFSSGPSGGFNIIDWREVP